MQSRNKSRPYKLASPTQSNKLTPLSDDSLSERTSQSYRKRRPRSAFTSYESPQRSSRVDSTSSAAPSVYLIEVKNTNRPKNSYGLTKTVTYVWRNNHLQTKKDDDVNNYPKYSVEQVPPIFSENKRSIPVTSRHVTLQRGKTDCWQNNQPTSNSILTSTCQNHTGSASNILSPNFESKQNGIQHRPKSSGHVISVTTTKRDQPSLLNERQNTEWNIEGDGKHIRYSNLKWYSADQLQKPNRLIIKPRTKRRHQTSDTATDTGSSSDQHNRSAPPILLRKFNTDVINEIHEGFESPIMNKQNDLTIPDYSSFHREINDTSSPIIHNEEQQNLSSSSSPASSSSSKEIQHIETILNEYTSVLRKRKLNCYASTDEDVDELNIDSSEDVDQSVQTIQTYRDQLYARLNVESNPFRSRIVSMEYSQITVDSGVDIISEQKISQPKIDEHHSEETTNQNDLFALSDDSLLDIETTHPHGLLLKTPAITHEQSLSLAGEGDEYRSFLTAMTDSNLNTKNDRGPANTSEQYYSAESEFNTSLAVANQELQQSFEVENVIDENSEEKETENIIEEKKNQSTELSRTPSPRFDFTLPTFGDWIDHVFTTFLAETNQYSSSTSRSSSIISIQTSQNTIDTSSSQVRSVIETANKNQQLTGISRNLDTHEENNPSNVACRQSQSWPNDEQHEEQQDELNRKGNYEEMTNINEQEEHKTSQSLLLSSNKNGGDDDDDDDDEGEFLLF
ncbi:hypothetical protein I4U23_007708 [Adineta vaga]|nr:hypothetical protein I4U23_007708 [Adineta vaga]